MKKLFLLMIIFSVSFIGSCKKDGNGNKLNTIQITDGEFSGYEHVFTPNLGFWSPANETTRYVHLVLGDDDNMATIAENVMSIVFYHSGAAQVQFPSAEGQWIQFGLNIDGTVYYFQEESALLTITQIDDMHFEGTLTGQFAKINNSADKISLTLFISIPLQQI